MHLTIFAIALAAVLVATSRYVLNVKYRDACKVAAICTALPVMTIGKPFTVFPLGAVFFKLFAAAFDAIILVYYPWAFVVFVFICHRGASDNAKAFVTTAFKRQIKYIFMLFVFPFFLQLIIVVMRVRV